MQEIFTLAAGDGNDARIVKPGVAGMSVLLQSHFSDHLFSVEDIGGVFVALSLGEECSFTYDEFETFVNQLFFILKTNSDRAGGAANAKAQEATYVPRVSPDVGVSALAMATPLSC